MKILMLTSEFYPQVFGGLGTQVGGLCKALRNNGHEVHVVMLKAEPFLSNENWCADEYTGIEVSPVQMPVYSGVYWIDQISSNVHLLSFLYQYCIDREYDVAHCHSWIPFAAASEFCKLKNIPLISTFHRVQSFREEAYRDSIEDRFVVGMDRWMRDSSDQVICVSNEVTRQVQSLSPLAREIHTVLCGLDVRRFHATLEKKGLHTPKCVLFVGRLVPEKGLRTLLDAMAMLEGKGLSLIIAGEGPEAELIDSYLDRIKIQYLGDIDSALIADVYVQADVVVVPSTTEPFGTVVIEALAMGKPVIASNVGGMTEILEGNPDLGSLVSAGDVDGFAAQILEWCRKPSSTSAMHERRNYAISRYSWEELVSKTMDIYHSAIKQFN